MLCSRKIETFRTSVEYQWWIKIFLCQFSPLPKISDCRKVSVRVRYSATNIKAYGLRNSGHGQKLFCNHFFFEAGTTLTSRIFNSPVSLPHEIFWRCWILHSPIGNQHSFVKKLFSGTRKFMKKAFCFNKMVAGNFWVVLRCKNIFRSVEKSPRGHLSLQELKLAVGYNVRGDPTHESWVFEVQKHREVFRQSQFPSNSFSISPLDQFSQVSYGCDPTHESWVEYTVTRYSS